MHIFLPHPQSWWNDPAEVGKQGSESLRARPTPHYWRRLKFDHSKLKDRHALFVTSLRDPLARIRSGYEFEGHVVQARAGPLLYILEWVDTVNKAASKRYYRKQLWSCVSDCYCRWFESNHSNRNASRAEECELAYQTIQSALLTLFISTRSGAYQQPGNAF